jgi:CheY-like chemotaxis protein
MSTLPVLYAEDDEHDIFFLQHAFKKAEILNPLHVAQDGQAAIDYLSRAGSHGTSPSRSLPCLIILDLKMPRMTGLEVLAWLRRESGLPPLPVIMFSSSAHNNDVAQALGLGANAFVVKPSDVDERARFARAVKEFWLHFNDLCTIGDS